jgi:hypothetical protein
MKNAHNYGIDWNNVDLNQGYNQDQKVINGLSFKTLLLEIHCNVKDITEEEVMKQFETDLQSRIQSAREIMQSNAANIANHANEYRANLEG